MPFLSILTNDCIAKGKDYNGGGARYNTKYIQGVGIGTITDCLAAVKYNVYDEKRFTMAELLKALDDNFAGHERILNLVKNKTPKYGNDDDYADDIMKSVFESVSYTHLDVYKRQPSGESAGNTYHHGFGAQPYLR